MGFFDFLRTPSIQQGVEEQAAQKGSVLVDVRMPEEYQAGHIPGSKNIPLPSIDKIREVADNQDTPLYVYCYSGARSQQAVRVLQRMGYRNAKNIGGIAAWHGKVEQ